MSNRGYISRTEENKKNIKIEGDWAMDTGTNWGALHTTSYAERTG